MTNHLQSKVLEVDNLKTYITTERGTVKAVDGVSFTVNEREVLGIVGESGCGKSITALSIMQLLPEKFAKIESGSIKYQPRNGNEEVDIAKLNSKGIEMRSIRGKEIAMIFQEPMTSLNPVYTVGEQIIESILLHEKTTKKEAWKRAIELLKHVGIPDPEQRVNNFPHQMSGGMRQRVMIAMALSCNPRFLIADEPTTALDVTIQAQILDLMKRLQKEHDMSIMMITHNMGVVGLMCHRVIVMYLGRIVEEAPVREIFSKPLHPYTLGLLNSIPRLNPKEKKKDRLVPISGNIPDPNEVIVGCRFALRCPHASERCQEEPPLIEVEPGHKVRCWLHE